MEGITGNSKGTFVDAVIEVLLMRVQLAVLIDDHSNLHNQCLDESLESLFRRLQKVCTLAISSIVVGKKHLTIVNNTLIAVPSLELSK